MSSTDDLRRMRAEKYARARAATSGTTPPDTSAPRAAAPSRARKAPVAPEAPAAEAGTCGHKSMNGRACTRPAGHTEKNHRYS